MLTLRRADDKAVERGRYLDLAGQPAVGFQLLGEIQHLLFHVLARRQSRKPFRIDIDVAGGAGAGPAAIGVDAGNAVLDRALHDGPADRNVRGVLLAVVFDVFDFRHAGLCSPSKTRTGLGVNRDRSGLAQVSPASPPPDPPTRYGATADRPPHQREMET